MTATPATLTDGHREMIQTIGELLRDEHTEFSLYLTGSLATGLGSPTSDLDLVAVVPDAGDPARRFADRDFAGRGGFTCDLQTVTASGLAAWFDRLDSWESTCEDYANVLTLRWVLRDLTRFVMSRALVDAQSLEAWRAKLDMDAYRRAYIAHHLADAATFVRDTAGFVRSGDTATAWETSTRALRGVAEAALGAMENFNYSGKFLLRRLRQEPLLEEFADQAWDALYRSSADEQGRERELARRRRLTGDLSAHVYLYGWKPGHARPFESDPGRGVETVCRSLEDIVLRTADGAVVLGRHARGITTASGLVWCLADGTREPDGIVADFAGAVGRAADDVRTWVLAEIDALADAGLVERQDGARSVQRRETPEGAPC